eukprot:gene25250-biopygen9011
MTSLGAEDAPALVQCVAASSAGHAAAVQTVSRGANRVRTMREQGANRAQTGCERRANWERIGCGRRAAVRGQRAGGFSGSQRLGRCGGATPARRRARAAGVARVWGIGLRCRTRACLHKKCGCTYPEVYGIAPLLSTPLRDPRTARVRCPSLCVPLCLARVQWRWRGRGAGRKPLAAWAHPCAGAARDPCWGVVGRALAVR